MNHGAIRECASTEHVDIDAELALELLDRIVATGAHEGTGREVDELAAVRAPATA